CDFLQRRLHDQFESRDPDHDFHGPVRIGDTDYPVRMQWNLRGRLHPLRPGPQDDLPVARGAEYPRDPPVHVARAADERPEAHPFPYRRPVTHGLTTREIHYTFPQNTCTCTPLAATSINVPCAFATPRVAGEGIPPRCPSPPPRPL